MVDLRLKFKSPDFQYSSLATLSCFCKDQKIKVVGANKQNTKLEGEGYMKSRISVLECGE